ncbi:hypothetical protein B566_EDAN007747 [Ephemera danica]|nr:hypothetical protein B566_EDAN007747 [Ephemera danica]
MKRSDQQIIIMNGVVIGFAVLAAVLTQGWCLECHLCLDLENCNEPLNNTFSDVIPCTGSNASCVTVSYKVKSVNKTMRDCVHIGADAYCIRKQQQIELSLTEVTEFKCDLCTGNLCNTAPSMVPAFLSVIVVPLLMFYTGIPRVSVQ